jgi:O-acetylhomoserine/O-acetylserine sulfhydrylase-like pyridoxal-dependent enzyme
LTLGTRSLRSDLFLFRITQTFNQFKGILSSRHYFFNNSRRPIIVTLKNFGIDVKFVSSTEPAAFAAAIDGKTKAVYIESVGNPNYTVHDIPAIAKARMRSTVHCYDLSHLRLCLN